jgi:GT2 family glycosyltransferase
LPRAGIFSGFALLHWPQDTLRQVDILSGCFWLVRRDALKQVGLLDESFFMYGEDMDWCKRFWDAGWKVVFVPSAEAIHYGGASSANSPVRFYVERQRADMQYWKKHHSAPAVGCFFLISCLHLALRSVGYAIVSIVSTRKREAYCYKVRRSLACLRWMFSGRVPAPAAAKI